MSLLDQLREDMKAAMRAGEKDRLTVIRMLIAEVQAGELKDEKAEDVVQGYHKRLRKSRDEYSKLGEADRVAEIDAELKVVDHYVPDAPSPEMTAQLVDEFLAANTQLGPSDVGRAMGQLMKEHPNQIDPATANKRLREVLDQRQAQ